jgi:hypothetical protein
MNQIKVFISYSHDSDDYREKVLALSEPLRAISDYAVTSESGYQNLYDFLLGQAGVEARPVGAVKIKSRKTGTPLTFDKPIPLPCSADISRVDKYAPANLIGRAAETQLLNDAWAKVQSQATPRPHILTFVALGGEGKTSLMAKWTADLEDVRLLTVNRDAAGTLLAQDAHPLVQQYFAKRMKDEGRGMKEGMRDKGGGMNYPWESVAHDLAEAERLIHDCGYHRRHLAARRFQHGGERSRLCAHDAISRQHHDRLQQRAHFGEQFDGRDWLGLSNFQCAATRFGLCRRRAGSARIRQPRSGRVCAGHVADATEPDVEFGRALRIPNRAARIERDGAFARRRFGGVVWHFGQRQFVSAARAISRITFRACVSPTIGAAIRFMQRWTRACCP